MPDLVPPDEAQHHERLRIARDLHDTLAQSLAGLGYDLDAVIADENLADPTRRQLRKIRLDLSNLLHELRDEILVLRTVGESEIESWLRSRLTLDLKWRRVEANPALLHRGLEIAHLLLELFNNAISYQGLCSAEIEERSTELSVRFLTFGIEERKSAHPVGVRLGRVGVSERLSLLDIDLSESQEGFTLRWR